VDSVNPDRAELDTIFEVTIKMGRPLAETAALREFDG
jgi:hypothetical protein